MAISHAIIEDARKIRREHPSMSWQHAVGRAIKEAGPEHGPRMPRRRSEGKRHHKAYTRHLKDGTVVHVKAN